MYKHILFPTDGSELSRSAAETAAALAKSLGAKITAIHVIAQYAMPVSDMTFGYVPMISPAEYERAAKRAASEYLAQVVAAAKSAGVECETTAEAGGAPWDAIVRTAAKRKCDLIVMASHGRRGVAAMVLGSETQKVLTHSKIPVLVCR